jgi:ubiquinone/menaquinone biosynthesis C-methylase UbiE
MAFVPALRASGVEIMDSGNYAPAELRSNLADLRFYNRWLGGARLIQKELSRLLAEAGQDAGGPVRVLDIATGSADIPLALERWGRRRGLDLRAEGVDTNPDIVGEARSYLDSQNAAGVRVRQADACQLPHADRSVDYVVCSNFLHHLEEDEALAALAEMQRVAARGVVAVDLQRRGSAWLNVWLLTRLSTFNRLTRNDGPMSVTRAFTVTEMEALARRAGIVNARVRVAGPVRMVLTWSR